MSFGYHGLLDCSNVPKKICENDKLISNVFSEIAKELEFTVISTNRYRFGFDSPDGCTVVMMLDESHITAHSYSEKRKIAFDIFTVKSRESCESAIEKLTSKLNIKDFTHKILKRN